MTVKLAKFFSNSSSSNSVAHTPSPPLSPPNHSVETNPYYNSMGYQQQTHYNPYMEDDDNLSMYSTSTSIMTNRDHPYNNSQRPLLADRKPQLLNKKKLQPQIQSKNNNNHHQYHKQQALHHLQNQQQHNYHHQDNCKPYISPYVQQQKRDSAKGLHGFNDFDILSQQYNQHLQSPHIGYPYGSPPSPTITTVNASDFTFDPLPSNPPPPFISSSSTASSSSASALASHIATTKLTSTPSPQTARYANIKGINTSYPTVSTKILSPLYSHNEYNNYESCNNHILKNPSNEHFIGKSSRFEDDFCTRRNIEFSKSSLDHDTNSFNDTSSTSKNGPFVFDPIHAQQYTTAPHGFNSLLAKNGRGFYDSIDNMDSTSVINPENNYNSDEKVKYSLPSGQTTMQSSSDTSSSSRDSKATKGLKSLLKRRKSNKKNKKDNKENNNGKPEEDIKKTETTTTKPTIKCVVVGDGAVGKTNLILSYLENRFNTEHVPTASDIYNADVMVNDSPVHLTLCDTAGQDTLDPLRELCYPDSDVFLLCFSVTKPETFHAIKSKWAPKFAKTKAALILVGTQSDLRTNSNVLNKLQTTGEKPISYADAWDLATTIGAKYIETSSATQDKVKEVFDTAIWEGLLPTTLPPTPSFWRKLFCLA